MPIHSKEAKVRLSSFTDYGVRMLMRMASAPDRAFSTAELAEEFGLSRNHLSKIIQRLARAGIVETKRSSGGGATLARPPSATRLGDLVRLLEENHALVECFPNGQGLCTLDSRCALKGRLHAAERACLQELDRATLDDIALRAPLGAVRKSDRSRSRA